MSACDRICAVAIAMGFLLCLGGALSSHRGVDSQLAAGRGDGGASAPSSAPASSLRAPLTFIRNEGGLGPDVLFHETGLRHNMRFLRDGVLLTMRREAGASESQAAAEAAVRLRFEGGNPRPEVVPDAPLSGTANFFLGSDRSAWRTGVPTYGAILYRQVYPGIDVRFYGNDGQLEFDLVVAPGADPSRAKLVYDGADALRVAASGDLEIAVGDGTLVQRRPFVYQDTAGKRRQVEGQYLVARGEAQGPAAARWVSSFQIAAYDHARPLVIDPVLDFSTFVGGSGLDRGEAVAVDGVGNIYLAGWTWSQDLLATQWRKLASGTSEDLRAVWGASAADLFVAASSWAGNSTAIRRFSGGSWSASGEFPGRVNALWGSGPADVYAVGVETASWRSVVRRFDGISWSVLDTVPGLAKELTGVWGSSAADVFAVGAGGTILHFDGAAWSAMESGTAADLLAVWGSSATDVYAVGAGGVVLHYTGGSWVAVSTGAAVLLTGVWGSAADNVFVVGEAGTILHFDGAAWSPMDSGTKEDFHAISGSGPAQVVAVGKSMSTTFLPAIIIRVFDGTTWRPTSGGSTDHTTGLYGVWCAPDGRAFAVGEDGLLLRRVALSYPILFPAGHWDGFVLKLDPTGSRLLYATYFGGHDDDRILDIAVDAAGNAYITGSTYSKDMPTVKALYPRIQAPDAFVAKISAAGTALEYATFLGGRRADAGNAIAVDPAGNACVAGTTESFNFPTKNALFPRLRGSEDAFVARLTPDGSALRYSTFLGGSAVDYAYGLATDDQGYAYVGGRTYSTDFPKVRPLDATYAGDGEGFVAKFAPAGKPLVFSTYFGGKSDDIVTAIALNRQRDVYLTGFTHSRDLPQLNPLSRSPSGHTEAFVARLAASGRSLVYSTFLKGSWTDRGFDIAVDGKGYAYVVGETWSRDLPVPNGLFRSHGGGYTDGFLARIAPAGGVLEYATYLGGAADDIATGVAVTPAGKALATGYTSSANFPVKNALYRRKKAVEDAFLVKVSPR